MQQILNTIKNILIKYDDLRTQPWTHLFVLTINLYFTPMVILYLILLTVNVNSGIADIIPFYLYFTFPYFCTLAILSLIWCFINIFLKKKTQNRILTKNKLYGFYWHIGILLFEILLFYLAISFLNSVRFHRWLDTLKFLQ